MVVGPEAGDVGCLVRTTFFCVIREFAREGGGWDGG